jgi:Tfp pilus assembly protein PilF
MTMIDNLESMLDKGKDNVLLRFSLGKAYLDQKDYSEAILHLKKALEFDTDYSAAWKLLGKAQMENQQQDEARKTLQHGVNVAREKGDIQAMREMQVALRRLDKK